MVEKLQVTQVLPLPSNTIVCFQSMGVGIIKSFKCQYCRLMTQRQIKDYKEGKLTKLDV